MELLRDLTVSGGLRISQSSMGAVEAAVSFRLAVSAMGRAKTKEKKGVCMHEKRKKKELFCLISGEIGQKKSQSES